MSVSYTKSEGEIYLASIKYTGHEGGSPPPRYEVKFILETRGDAFYRYTTLFPVKTAYRLRSIQILDNNQLFREYVLA